MMMKTQTESVSLAHVCRPKGRGAFTLIELLVVMVIIAILASLLLPALAKGKQKALALRCHSQIRRVAFAWLLYSEDSEGRVPFNQTNSYDSWVGGVMGFNPDVNDSTDLSKLMDPPWSKIGPYVQNAAAFKCPSDKSKVMVGSPGDFHGAPRVRSYSMNTAVGFPGRPGKEFFSPGWMTYNRLSQMVRPSPDQLWIITEEHPDGITDCAFTVDCKNQGPNARFISVPANYHKGAANISFADGHVELHKWQDERTKVENKYCGCLGHYEREGYFLNSPNNPDIGWLQSHTSAPMD